MDMTMETKMTMELAGETMDVNMDMNMLMTGYNTPDFKYQMDATTGLLGQNIEMTAFYTDGYYYMETAGQKIKYPYDLDQITELVQENQTNMVSDDAMTELTRKRKGKTHGLPSQEIRRR